jgi:hypothetical protein
MRKAAVIWLIISIVFFAGCAVGNKHAYHTVDANIAAEGTTKVAVATHDQRSYVKNGNKQPDFVGLQRGGFGNPFDIKTVTGNALAQEFTEAVCRSLASRGFHTTPVIVNYSETSYTVKADLSKTGAKRLILITLYEWKSDTYNNTALIYDVNLEVFDEHGNIIAKNSINGRDDLGGSLMNPPAHAKKVIPIAFKEKIESLLNYKNISETLESK